MGSDRIVDFEFAADDLNNTYHIIAEFYAAVRKGKNESAGSFKTSRELRGTDVLTFSIVTNPVVLCHTFVFRET